MIAVRLHINNSDDCIRMCKLSVKLVAFMPRKHHM